MGRKRRQTKLTRVRHLYRLESNGCAWLVEVDEEGRLWVYLNGMGSGNMQLALMDGENALLTQDPKGDR